MQGFTKYISPGKLDEHPKNENKIKIIKKCKLRQAKAS